MCQGWRAVRGWGAVCALWCEPRRHGAARHMKFFLYYSLKFSLKTFKCFSRCCTPYEAPTPMHDQPTPYYGPTRSRPYGMV